MPSDSHGYGALFERHDILVRELLDVNRRLHSYALEAKPESAVTNGKSGNGHPARYGKTANGAARKRHAWFERGEALKLMQLIAKKPMHQADLVRAIAAKKTATAKLSPVDAKRFQSATFQAIANAVAGRKLVAAKDGTVRARAGA